MVPVQRAVCECLTINSGLWTTSFYLGNFIGPTVAGAMVQAMGFRVTTSMFSAVYLAMIVASGADIGYKIRREKKQVARQNEDETTRLISATCK